MLKGCSGMSRELEAGQVYQSKSEDREGLSHTGPSCKPTGFLQDTHRQTLNSEGLPGMAGWLGAGTRTAMSGSRNWPLG